MANDKTSKDNKYGDVNALVGDDNTPQVRRTRPRQSPALAAMSGERHAAVSVNKKLKDEAESAKKELALVTSKLKEVEGKAKEYKAQLGDSSEGHVFTVKMPVTGVDVKFKQAYIDTALIDISPENERIQEFLDEVSLADILPDIRVNGQDTPGMVRPYGEGRYQLIRGSRRLKSVTFCQKPFLALIGDVPDADVETVSRNENSQRKDTSYYEKALKFKKQVENGKYASWKELGEKMGMSAPQMTRYKTLCELDKRFVAILPSPSDMALTYGVEIVASLKKNPEQVMAELSLLEAEREQYRLQSIYPDEYSGEQKMTPSLSYGDIIKRFQKAAKPTMEKPTERKSIPYTSKKYEGVVLKHSLTNKGATKFEISGLEQSALEKLFDSIRKELQLVR